MPTYTYRGINTTGKMVSASIEAANMELAKTSLRNAGYTVYEMRGQSFYERSFDIPLFGKPKEKDMSIFCREMSSILRAGVPVTSALGMMEQQTENKQLQRAVAEMQRDVAKGDTLAMSMGRHNKLFPNMLISMVAAGEESGNLESVFSQMEDYFEKIKKTKSTVTKAMIYPIILIIVMIIVTIVLMVKIVPMFTETYADSGIELPKITQGVVAVSGWIGHWWWVLAAILAATVAALTAFGKTNRGKHVYGFITRKLPVVNKLVVRSACATFSRIFSMLLASGLSLFDAINLAAANMSNIYFREALITARELVTQGWPLYVGLRDTNMFPPLVINMVSIGESSGDLQGSLEKLADFYDQEVSDQTGKLLALMEPMIILVMAVFVVILVLAIYLPMLQMTKVYDQYL